MKNTSIENKHITYSHISAVSKNHVIGHKGKLPWHIPKDLAFFHKKTLHKALIMGRKTFESLGNPLPHRLNIVITRQKNFQPSPTIKNHIPIWIGDQLTGGNMDLHLKALQKSLAFVVSPSLKSAKAFCSRPEVIDQYGKEVFIIGGGEIYKQSLAFVQKIYLTRIHKHYTGDAFYPPLDTSQFKEVKRQDLEGDPSYSFITYERILPKALKK